MLHMVFKTDKKETHPHPLSYITATVRWGGGREQGCSEIEQPYKRKKMLQEWKQKICELKGLPYHLEDLCGQSSYRSRHGDHPDHRYSGNIPSPIALPHRSVFRQRCSHLLNLLQKRINNHWSDSGFSTYQAVESFNLDATWLLNLIFRVRKCFKTNYNTNNDFTLQRCLLKFLLLPQSAGR